MTPSHKSDYSLVLPTSVQDLLIEDGLYIVISPADNSGLRLDGSFDSCYYSNNARLNSLRNKNIDGL